MRRTTETYEHTINGLLQKRAEMMEEIAVTRERLAVLSNDIEALGACPSSDWSTGDESDSLWGHEQAFSPVED